MIGRRLCATLRRVKKRRGAKKIGNFGHVLPMAQSQRIAYSALYEAEIWPPSRNDSNFNKRVIDCRELNRPNHEPPRTGVATWTATLNAKPFGHGLAPTFLWGGERRQGIRRASRYA